MTRAEALAEAQRRWGSYGDAPHSYAPATAYWIPCADDTETFYVGTLKADGSADVKGSGDSWEAAFADADRRAAR